MAFVFYECVLPGSTLRAHAESGGESLSMHIAPVVSGGLLRVMSALEPIDRTTLKHHLSISVGPREGQPVRRPTDEECKAAMNLWHTVSFEEDNDGATSLLVRHFWEK